MVTEISCGSWEELDAREVRKRRDKEPEAQYTMTEGSPDFVSLLLSSAVEYDPGRRRALAISAKYSK